MDERINRVASLANLSNYDATTTNRYIDGAPHIKHAALRLLYGKLVVQIFDFARQHTAMPKVLDLGAGEGSVTLPFLELGAKVTAIDISPSQLDVLRTKCATFGCMLEIRCEDINIALRDECQKYDIIVANSFLHHVPDYIGLIDSAMKKLNPNGQFFSFQDPLQFSSVGRFTLLFNNLAYFSWRIFKGDVINGLKRRLRRRRGIYLADSLHDNAEYHVVRNGVDQKAIYKSITEQGFDCHIESYFSTQSSFYQFVGTAFGVKNTFAVIATHRR